MADHEEPPSGLDDDPRLSELPPADRLRLRKLTDREIEVSLLAARRLSTREIARELGVAESTVKTLLARARDKLDYRTTRDLATDFVRTGLVRPEEMRNPRAE